MARPLVIRLKHQTAVLGYLDVIRARSFRYFSKGYQMMAQTLDLKDLRKNLILGEQDIYEKSSQDQSPSDIPP